MKRKSTSTDVAQLAGVSRATVSYILNNVSHFHVPEETRQRVLEAARQLNYHPNAAARSLVQQQTYTLGFVLCQTPERLSKDAFLPAFAMGIRSVTSAAGFKLLLEAVEDVTRPDAYMRLVHESHIDGIILSGPRSDDLQLPQLRAINFPVVLIGRLLGTDFSYVDVDNVAAAQKAVEHLISLGHKRIACITSSPLEYTASADRLQGYRQAVHLHGLSFDEALIRIGDHWEAGFEAMHSLLELSYPPSAVFVASDVVALGALRAVNTAGLSVPQDLAIVGFDDIPVAEHISPPLTTVHVPAQELGRTAAQMLLEIIQTGKSVPPIILETELIVRESCGAYLKST